MDPAIFKAYDIRGRYPEEVNREIAFKIGSAYGKLVTGKTIVVASDARESSPEIKDAIISGLYQSGKEIIDIGLSSTPMFYFAVNHLEAEGGIIVTASHLGKEFNGFKMVREKAIPISYDTGIAKIEEMVKTGGYNPSKYSTVKKDVKEAYLDFIVQKKIKIEGKIVVDTGNGMMGQVIKEFLERLGVNYAGLYFEVDCSFPNHVANPLKEETLNDLRNKLEEEDAILGVAFDGDGDRLGILDENGELIPGDFLTAIIAKRVLKDGPKKILYDLRSSKVVPEIIEDCGGEPVKSRIGHSFIKQRMRDENIFFSGELSGHFYFKETFNVESSLTALIKILETLSETGKTMSELVKPLKKYWKTDEINFEVDDKKEKLEEIEKIYSEKGTKIEKIDGVTVEFEDWWFNLRASNTENLLRLNLEADTKERARLAVQLRGNEAAGLNDHGFQADTVLWTHSIPLTRFYEPRHLYGWHARGTQSTFKSRGRTGSVPLCIRTEPEKGPSSGP